MAAAGGIYGRFTVGGRTVHFSNIDTSRLAFTPWQYPYGAVIKVQVHGPSTVVATYSQAHPTGTELDRYLLARDPQGLRAQD
jgi:hypothetical protein